MIRAFKYWAKVTLVILPWAAFSAELKIHDHVSDFWSMLTAVVGSFVSLLILVGHIPEMYE